MGPLLNGSGVLVTEDVEKTEVLIAFFSSVFISEIGLRKCHVPETRRKYGTT